MNVLLSEMVQADLEDRLVNYLKRIAKLDVLVIDDFLLRPPHKMNRNI